MPAERSRGRPHAAAFRGALWITLIALAATTVALTLQYVQTVRVVEAELRAIVDSEVQSLAGRYEQGGVIGLASFLAEQQRTARVRDYFYLLAMPDGRPLAGNLAAWPVEVPGVGWYSFPTTVVGSQGAHRRWVEARAVVLRPGFHLLVGHFADERIALREHYLQSLFWSLLTTGILGLELGWWLSRRALRFVETVSDAGERFLSGKLDERLPVTERRDEYDRLAETINACFAEVEHVVDSLRAATDGMAHDLKTPLTRIKARLELAAMRDADADELHASIEATTEELNNLLRLINAMLELARVGATTSESFTAVDIAAVVDEVIDLYRPVAEDKGIEFRVGLTSSHVRGNRMLIGQAIANIVDNAVKYTPAGGIVTIETIAEGNRAGVSIADTGPGIPPDERDRALTRFVRLEASRSTPGAGLGLSLVQTIARVHRGILRLSSDEGGLRVDLLFDREPGPPSVG